jgi:hypothetical protein
LGRCQLVYSSVLLTIINCGMCSLRVVRGQPAWVIPNAADS